MKIKNLFRNSNAYFKVFLLFLNAIIIGLLFKGGFSFFVNSDVTNIIFRVSVSFVFILYILYYKSYKLYNIISFNLASIIIGLTIVGLFVINNLIMVYFDFRIDYESNPQNLKYELLRITISSICEEIIYRGFIQNYINLNVKNQQNKILTKGNFFATILMLVTHLGFFLLFPFTFALSSLLLIVIFSLGVGYLMDNTKNILIPILIHITVNLTHIFIHLKFHLA